MRLNEADLDRTFETLGVMLVSPNAGNKLDNDQPKLSTIEKRLIQGIMDRISAALEDLPQSVSERLALARESAVANMRKLS